MKRNYWPLFFIGIFSFVFSMIIWTIISTSKASIDEDKSFLKTYQEVDDDYNKIMNSNVAFLEKYDFELLLNDKKFDLTTKDIMYSQRVLEKKSKHKNLLRVGKNNLVVTVINKEKNQKESVKIDLVVTKSSSNEKDINLVTSNFENEDNTYTNIFEIDEENNWNITGTFDINGNVGYIFIKTNAI